MSIFILSIVIKLLLLLLAGCWLTIAVSLIYRKKRTKHLALIEAAFADITSQYLYPSPEEPFDLIAVQRTFRKLGIVPNKPGNVQYLVNLMIRTQRSLLGENYHKIQELYKQIPPYRVSFNKLKSKKWHVKGRGIREIYEMDQQQYVKEVLREINNKNIYVRREAQIAMVVFLGWDSLRFLPYLKREMTLWQQIKVVEKLHDLYPVPKLKYLRKAYDSDKQYATELIMRIIRKFRIQEEVDFILRFLDSPKFDTRETALYCISSFKLNEDQINVVKQKFHNISNIEQQVQLLKYIDRISLNVDLEFYRLLLYQSNDVIKLSTAEILWNREYKEDIEEFY
ncbi:hypothetical protein LZ575_05540 [Antarcticibacterium sp. 1MA-6-2]|uniref:hypothetical protein n=1 Tax=Antarcticibacterium sp. 1MA-6-2 TaxID=2908210 RepID=UPI001F259A35|nr:hypothetical protein [Antarcticibacterium sp. 1MA-6-2]UJH92067.1 hypothetical protein LZ575_05540 [Antarcticibacterium sp. 1MA-6-2]